MPLIQGKSKKSFDKNIETEMHERKPQKQALAIAYNMKRKAKKMAMGGMAEHGEQSEAHEEDMMHEEHASEAPPSGYTKPEMEFHGHDLSKRDRAMNAFWGHSPSGDHGVEEGHQPSGQGHTIHIHVNPQADYDPTQTPGPKHNSPAAREDSRSLNQHGEDETGPMGSYAEGGQVMDDHQSDEFENDMVERIMQKRQNCYSEGGKVANEESGESTDNPESFAKADGNEFDDLAMRDDLESEYTGANSGDEDGSELNQEDDDEDMVGKIMRKRKK